MSHILLYSRLKTQEPTAEQTVTLLATQLDQIGHHVDIAHTLNISRFILNDYDTIHFVIENSPLTLNEALHLGLCKALQKNTLISLLNSNLNSSQNAWLKLIPPDALSVSQTNHFKHFRWMSRHKFVMPPLPKLGLTTTNETFTHQAYFSILFESLDEACHYHLDAPVYFDGRALLAKYSAAQLRKKWNQLISQRKINTDSNLLLSDNKIDELLNAGHLAVILAQAELRPTELCQRLSQALNKNNLVIINEHQSTGFSKHWTSGQNCLVVSGSNWLSKLNMLMENKKFNSSQSKTHELYDDITNELSRLYAKLSQQKTTLLTSRSAKL